MLERGVTSPLTAFSSRRPQLLARLRDDHVFLPQARQRQFAVGTALRQPPERLVLAGMVEGVAEVAQPANDFQRQAPAGLASRLETSSSFRSKDSTVLKCSCSL